MGDIDLATSFAIYAAKQQSSEEVTTNHILLGCLRVLSRFGVMTLGPWNIDLEPLGVDWMKQPDGPRPKVAYSQAAVELFDRGARIAKSSGAASVSLYHLLAAFAAEEGGLMGELKRAHGITSASWRAALARLTVEETKVAASEDDKTGKMVRDYLTPEEAAEALGIHVQTMRSYIRSERVPAFRVAGERAIRILRTDLEKVLEPLRGEHKEE
jgi:excisionase family DNA binding protein